MGISVIQLWMNVTAHLDYLLVRLVRMNVLCQLPSVSP